MTQSTYYLIAAIVAVVAAVKPTIGVVRWAIVKIERRGWHKYEARVKDDFIFDVATNHLPHIEHSLELIAKHLDLEIPEPPPIRYLPFDPNKK